MPQQFFWDHVSGNKSSLCHKAKRTHDVENEKAGSRRFPRIADLAMHGSAKAVPCMLRSGIMPLKDLVLCLYSVI